MSLIEVTREQLDDLPDGTRVIAIHWVNGRDTLGTVHTVRIDHTYRYVVRWLDPKDGVWEQFSAYFNPTQQTTAFTYHIAEDA